MSVIQKIRDKYARVAVIAIALALLGFILMDAFAGRGSIFGGGDRRKVLHCAARKTKHHSKSFHH